jgi:predicted nucleotidyltransferase
MEYNQRMIRRIHKVNSKKRREPAVSMSEIRAFARRVVDRFQPEKIILFGSYAYGTPNVDSDVDIVVVMPARNQLDQAAKIRLAIPPPFSMDLIVRTPKNFRERLERGDLFTKEIATKGKILYEAVHKGKGQEGGSRSRHRQAKRARQNAAS